MLNKNQHSLALLRGIEKIMDEFEKIEEQYKERIEEIEPSRQSNVSEPTGFHKHVIAYIPVNRSLDFYFELRGVKDAGNGATHYFTVFKPQSETESGEYAGTGTLSTSLTRFANWVHLVEGYNNVRLSKKDKFLADSTKQFYDYFESADEDASTKPFNDDQQVFLYKLLEFVKSAVEQAENVDQEQAANIVEEIKLLQENIPSITKSTAVKNLSRIFARIKAFSMKLFVDTVDVAKKELIKAALYGGLHEIDQVVHHFS